jgi:hypothetical protein
MASNSWAAKPVYLTIGDTVPPLPPTIWSDVAEVYTLPDLALVRAVIDDTHHGPSYFRTSLPGVYEPISLPYELNYEALQYEAFLTDLKQESTQSTRWYRVVFPDSKADQFEAFVAGMTKQSPMEGRVTYTLTLQVTGPYSWVDHP